MQALWMVVGAFFFACMGVCIKFAAEYYSTAEIVFYRGLIGILVIGALAAQQGVSLRTRLPWMHAWRSAFGVTALGCWFYAIGQMPLASAMTLNYMSSIWIAVFLVAGALWTRWRRREQRPLHWPLLGAIAAGFAGVVLMLQPSFSAGQGLAAGLGLVSGLVSAMAYMQVSALSRAGEPEARTVFYFGLACTLAGAVATCINGTSSWPGWQAAAWLVPMGLFAAGGQMCMTRAYASATNARATLVVASLQYSGIVFAALFSVVLFADQLDWYAWLGMALIVASGVSATALRARQSAKRT